MKSRDHARLFPPSTEVRDSESKEPGFRISEREIGRPKSAKAGLRSSESDADGLRNAEERINAANAAKAEVLDEAFTLARLENKEIAHLCGVSVSLVEKWRKSDQRACPNLIQLLLLPPSFHLAMHRVMNRRYGFGRHALAQLIEATGLLAAVIE